MGLELEEGDEVFFRIYWPSVKKKTCIAIFFRSLVGRGNLNLNNNILIFNDIYGLIFVVEYHLEYRFPKRYFSWDSNLRPSRMLGLSAGRSLN